MKLEISKELLLCIYDQLSSEWKEMVEKEIPELFKVKYEKGKWYKISWKGKRCFVNSDGTAAEDNGTYGWGVDSDDRWCDIADWGGGLDTVTVLATPEEIETMLWEEAEKRGLGKDAKIVAHTDGSICSNSGKCTPCYIPEEDRLWNKNGVIYEKGKWATPLNEGILAEIEKLQSQIDKLKKKVK